MISITILCRSKDFRSSYGRLHELLVSLALFSGPSTLSREHFAIALKAARSLTAFSNFSVLFEHPLHMYGEIFPFFSTGTSRSWEILGPPLSDSSGGKKVYCIG